MKPMTTNPLEELAANLLLAGPGRGETAELPSATLDLDRQRRCGFGEVVYGEGKPLDVLLAIFTRLLEAGQAVLATRISAEKGAGLLQHFSAGRWNEAAKTFRVENFCGEKTNQQPNRPKRGKVAIITAGTSDLPVAAEAQETVDWMGVETVMVHDVGVAGPQRLLAKLPLLAGCDAIVVVAGMEADAGPRRESLFANQKQKAESSPDARNQG